MTAYGFFTNHQFGMPDGYMSQPNKVIEAIGLLQHLTNKSQDTATKKQEKNRKPYGLQGKTATSKPKRSVKGFKKGRPAPTPKVSVSRMKKK